MANIKRNINYLNRDFTSFRTDLINYAYNQLVAGYPSLVIPPTVFTGNLNFTGII